MKKTITEQLYMNKKLITTKILITVIDTCANTEALANLTDATKLSNYSATMKTVTLSEISWTQTLTKNIICIMKQSCGWSRLVNTINIY